VAPNYSFGSSTTTAELLPPGLRFFGSRTPAYGSVSGPQLAGGAPKSVVTRRRMRFNVDGEILICLCSAR
jgi:hypothetical protein